MHNGPYPPNCSAHANTLQLHFHNRLISIMVVYTPTYSTPPHTFRINKYTFRNTQGGGGRLEEEETVWRLTVKRWRE